MNAKDAIKQVREEHEPPVEPSAAPPAPAAAPAAEPADPTFNPEGSWESWMQRLLDVARTKFVNERVNGFQHPNGTAFPPVPQADAEARWLKVEPRFKALIQNDPDVRSKFSPAETGAPETGGPEAPPVETPPSESESPPQEIPPT